MAFIISKTSTRHQQDMANQGNCITWSKIIEKITRLRLPLVSATNYINLVLNTKLEEVKVMEDQDYDYGYCEFDEWPYFIKQTITKVNSINFLKRGWNYSLNCGYRVFEGWLYFTPARFYG